MHAMKKSGAVSILFILLIPLAFSQLSPTIKIISPQQGELLRDGVVNIVFSVQNYEYSPESIHIHFTLDKNLPKMHFNFDPFVLENIAYGGHVLDVQLVNAKHFPLLNPEAHAVVRFSVGQEGISPVEPLASSSQPLTPVTPGPSPPTPDKSVPIGQVYQAVSSAKDIPSAVPLGKASDFLQQILAVGKGSITYIFLLFLAGSVIVGGYYGYAKLVQGHFAEVPSTVQYNQQLYDYIRKCMIQGFQKQAIYNKLKSLKFREDDLTYHFSKVEQELPKAK